MLKRLLLFLLIIAVLTGGLLLFAWWRGEMPDKSETTGSKLLYYICSAIALILIYCITDWIVKGKNK